MSHVELSFASDKEELATVFTDKTKLAIQKAKMDMKPN